MKTAKNPKRVRLKIVQLAHAAGLPLPAYQTEHAAGLDLVAAVIIADPIILQPGARALVPTGIVMEIPSGFEAQVRPRSGLAFKHGVTVLNSPGTIDADYRGELKVLLINLGGEPFPIARGDRIAQLVIAPVTTAKLKASIELTSTERGAGGFGSTGTNEKAQQKKLEALRAKSKSKPEKRPPVKKANDNKPIRRNQTSRNG